MDFQSLLASTQQFLSLGIANGLVAGMLVGGITWALINYPDYLFRGLFGLLLGFAITGMIFAPSLARNFTLLKAAAGGPMPQGTVHSILDLLMQMGAGALGGALLAMLISAPRETILGVLFGAIAGIILGGLVVITLSGTLDSRYYQPVVGLLTMVIFAVLGST